MNAVETALVAERSKVIAELKSLTNSKSSTQLESAISVWSGMWENSTVFSTIRNAPNQEKAILDACKQLRLRKCNGIALLYALNQFRAAYGYYQYLGTMMEMHEKHWALMLERCPGSHYGQK